MTDRVSSMLARYVHDSTRDLPTATLHEVRRRVLDSIGVAVAGLAEAAPVAARRYAEALGGDVTVWGTDRRSSVEAAGFANAVAVRALDFNDTYLSREPLHPSDTIAPLVALAEARGIGARELVDAIAVAYEAGVALCDAASPRAHGWDHVNLTAVATACGAGRLLGVEPQRLEHALALTVVPHAAMRETRVGGLSMWKGAAAASAARGAVTATLLAEAGMTGPDRPFEGEMGFVHLVLGGEPFDDAALGRLRRLEPPSRILDTYVKRWPVEYHAQSAVEAALRLHGDLGDPSQIAWIRIDTFRASYEIIAEDRQKWDPRTRETADHSLPYIVCAALQDGAVTQQTFDLARVRRADTLDLLQRTTVREDAALTAGYPEGIPNRIVVTTRGGVALEETVTYPRGHARDPMSDDELVDKYRANVAERWSAQRAAAVEDVVWCLGDDGSLESLMEGLRG